MRPHRWIALPLAACVGLVAATCTGAGADRVGGRIGGRIEVLAVWTGAEAARFARVVSGFEAATGVQVTYTAAGPDGVPATLAGRFQVGNRPDVAFLPQPGTLRDYAARGLLVPLDPATAQLVVANYPAVWRRLGSFGSRLYGVWFKAADKSLVWYDVGIFERLGLAPPDDIDRLLAVARRVSAAGLPAFAVGGADRWTLTDWFENLYLSVAGPERYNLLAGHRLAWTDPSVISTLHLMSDLLAPGLLAGGSAGALRTTFTGSVEQVFDRPPSAAMTMEGDFVAGVVTASTPAVLGVDADAFPFPAVATTPAGVVGGGDVAVLLRRSPAGAAFLRYLATPAAAARWAPLGGFLSPNANLDPALYPDDLTRSEARSILDAGDSFCFDLSDLQPPQFGSAPSVGLQGELARFLVDRDVDATARRLEAAATAAYG